MMENLFQISRFTVVGGIATMLHAGVVFLLSTITDWPAILVHCAGFGSAFAVSFAGHYYFTFASEEKIHEAVIRFFAVSLTALAISSLILAAAESFGFARLLSLVVAACSVPVFTFIVSKRFVF